MKLKLLILLLMLQFSLLMQAQYVTVKGKQFIDENGNNFYPVMANYGLTIAYPPPTNSTPPPISNCYLSQTNQYDTSFTFDCNNWPTCNIRWKDDFSKMKDMGFNVIHIGFDPMHDVNGFYFNLTENPYPHMFGVGYKYYLTKPFANDPYLQFYFSCLDSIINYANNIGIKIFLDPAEKNSLATYAALPDYLEYLTLLGQHIHNNSKANATFFAYRLYAEPYFNDNSNPANTKQKVCELTTQWYDSLKSPSVDPNHLITCDGSVGYYDVLKWDWSIIKEDFSTVHFYPSFPAYENPPFPQHHNIPYAMDRVNTLLYYLKNNMPYPWMVGETGFSADSTFSTPFIHGDYTEQAAYVQATLDGVRNAGGSGYSLWQYQEVFWSAGLDGGLEDMYGILKHGDAQNPAVYPSLKKPCVSNITNYLNAQGQPPAQQTFTQPSAYYDPYHTATYSVNCPPNQIIHGTVTDSIGNPITDAFLLAHTFMHWDHQDLKNHIYTPIDNVYNTFSLPDVNGSFSLTPFDPEAVVDSSMQHVRWPQCSALGAGYQQKQCWGCFTPILWDTLNPIVSIPNVTNPNFSLKKIEININEIVQNQNILSGQNKTYQARKTLTAKNVTVQQYATADFIAFDEVNVEQEFNADYGSEVHIFTTPPVHTDCNLLGGSFNSRTMQPSVPYAETVENTSTSFELLFKKRLPLESVNIFPNPSAGIFTVNYYGSDDNLKTVKVFNLLGSSIKDFAFSGNSTVLDLSTLPKGIYYFQLKDRSGIFNKKLIIN